MKNLIIIIVIIALGLQIESTKLGRQLKESVCSNKDGVMVAMPGSCTGFFFCINGNAIASSCGNFYHFNSRLSICDHPKRALCDITLAKPNYQVESDQEAEDICRRTIMDVHVFGKSKSCTQFYACHNKQLLKRVCPPQKHFNVKLKVCQDIKLARCVYAAPLVLPTAKPPTKLKKRQVPDYFCSRVKQDALIPHPWDCGLYVHCVHGKPQVMNCPRDLHFSRQSQRCEWSTMAKCGVMINGGV